MCANAFPEGAFNSARAVGPAAFFPGIDIFPSHLAGNGTVLIGDAAGANDPSQGQGLSLALRDVRELSQLLATEIDWQTAVDVFSRKRPTWYEPLRAYAIWQGPLTTDTGPDADAARERAKRAAEADPWRNGYGAIHALGPEGLPVTEDARRHFLGEDLD
jgi:2-polyprenyl-6-methoxyphenol hydroxylase-like FAD-dependent oxidoreductase